MAPWNTNTNEYVSPNVHENENPNRTTYNDKVNADDDAVDVIQYHCRIYDNHLSLQQDQLLSDTLFPQLF